jgi:hypothetical protein
LIGTQQLNPQWVEVQDAMKDRATRQAGSRYDVVSRVFRLKLAELLEDLRGGALGRHRGHIYCVEWQKRGLPHAHILLWLEPEDKPSTPEDYDELICAEIPNPDVFPELHELVKEHMLHGPCVGHQDKAPCLKTVMDKRGRVVEVKCGRGYPKKRREQCRLDFSRFVCATFPKAAVVLWFCLLKILFHLLKIRA